MRWRRCHLSERAAYTNYPPSCSHPPTWYGALRIHHLYYEISWNLQLGGSCAYATSQPPNSTGSPLISHTVDTPRRLTNVSISKTQSIFLWTLCLISATPIVRISQFWLTDFSRNGSVAAAHCRNQLLTLRAIEVYAQWRATVPIFLMNSESIPINITTAQLYYSPPDCIIPPLHTQYTTLSPTGHIGPLRIKLGRIEGFVIFIQIILIEGFELFLHENYTKTM
jgi:hypothetical protein